MQTLVCRLSVFLGEGSVQVFGPFLNHVVCFLSVEFKGCLYILDNSSLSGASFANIFSFYDLSSPFLDSVFHRVKVFNFIEVLFINYFFH